MTEAVDQCIKSSSFKWVMPGARFIECQLIDLKGKLYYFTSKGRNIPYKEYQVLLNVSFVGRVNLHNGMVGHIPDHVCSCLLSLKTWIDSKRKIRS